MLGGIVLSLAASPPVAARLGLDAFHFVNRHILFLAPAVVVMLATSFLSPRADPPRRAGRVPHLPRLVAATPFFGAEIKGARRWIVIFGVNMQPSEFLKPAFVILIAWLFAELTQAAGDAGQHHRARAAAASVVPLLVLQPDFGQTMLIALVWGALFFMAGMRFIWVGGLGGAAGAGLVVRLFHRAARRRAHQALPRPGLGRHLQHRSSRSNSFARGGWFGRGPGEGTVKRVLPDSHTDFVFAVAAEEFGIVLCLCCWRCSPSS